MCFHFTQWKWQSDSKMSEESLPATIADVPTPCLLVDLDKVKQNSQKMIDTAKIMGVHLRPHMKTHKTIEGGVIATGGTKRMVVVSTLKEAEFYADNGFDDILFGRPVSRDKLTRCQKLANRLTKFTLMYDSLHAVQFLQEAVLNPGKKWSVLLKVDAGTGRCGVLWDTDDVITLAKVACDADNIDFEGIYDYCSGSYLSKGEEEIRKFGAGQTERVMEIKKRLKEAGIECNTVGTGSTPACSFPDKSMSAFTEFHPGNYIFYDYMQTLIGSCTFDDIACRVATRVICQLESKHQLIVDCGFLAIGHDGMQKNLPGGFCVIQGEPSLRMVKVSQELGVIRAVEGNLDTRKYPPGTMLFIYPYHSCNTAALHPVYYVHSGEKIVDVWRPVKGW